MEVNQGSECDGILGSHLGLAMGLGLAKISLGFCQKNAYTHYDEHGTDTMGRYQDPRANMGHLISNF